MSDTCQMVCQYLTMPKLYYAYIEWERLSSQDRVYFVWRRGPHCHQCAAGPEAHAVTQRQTPEE